MTSLAGIDRSADRREEAGGGDVEEGHARRGQGGLCTLCGDEERKDSPGGSTRLFF